jgi:ABC-type iron transport system FetAB ATPase subunit
MLTYADSQVSMALGRAGGHVLLIGPGGGGKKTVGMITARLLGFKVCELQVAKPLCFELNLASCRCMRRTSRCCF